MTLLWGLVERPYRVSQNVVGMQTEQKVRIDHVVLHHSELIIDEAVSCALEAPRGPVFVDVPVSVAEARRAARPPRDRSVTRAAGPDEGSMLARARDRVAQAQRPYSRPRS